MSFWARHYFPANATLYVVGDIDVQVRCAEPCCALPCTGFTGFALRWPCFEVHWLACCAVSCQGCAPWHS